MVKKKGARVWTGVKNGRNAWTVEKKRSARSVLKKKKLDAMDLYVFCIANVLIN